MPRPAVRGYQKLFAVRNYFSSVYYFACIQYFACIHLIYIYTFYICKKKIIIIINKKIVDLVGIKTVYDVKIMTHSTTYIAVYIEIVFKIIIIIPTNIESHLILK